MRIYATTPEERKLLRQVKIQAAIDDTTISKWVADAIVAALSAELPVSLFPSEREVSR